MYVITETNKKTGCVKYFVLQRDTISSKVTGYTLTDGIVGATKMRTRCFANNTVEEFEWTGLISYTSGKDYSVVELDGVTHNNTNT